MAVVPVDERQVDPAALGHEARQPWSELVSTWRSPDEPQCRSTNSRTRRFDARSGLTLMWVANTFASTTVEYPQPLSTDVPRRRRKLGEVLEDLPTDRVRRASGAVDLARAGGELVLERAVDTCRVGMEQRLQLGERLERCQDRIATSGFPSDIGASAPRRASAVPSASNGTGRRRSRRPHRRSGGAWRRRWPARRSDRWTATCRSPTECPGVGEAPRSSMPYSRCGSTASCALRPRAGIRTLSPSGLSSRTDLVQNAARRLARQSTRTSANHSGRQVLTRPRLVARQDEEPAVVGVPTRRERGGHDDVCDRRRRRARGVTQTRSSSMCGSSATRRRPRTSDPSSAARSSARLRR